MANNKKAPQHALPKYGINQFIEDYPVYNNCLNIIAAIVNMLDNDIQTNSKEVIEPFETSLKEYLDDVLSYAHDDVEIFIKEINGELDEE